MATKTADNPAFVTNSQGVRPEHALVLVDGAATFYMGEFCRIATDGLIYEAITGANSGVGDDKIDYIAAEDVGTAIGNDTTRKSFFRVDVNDRFMMNELDTTVAEASVGQWAPLNVTSNVCTVDISGGATHAVFEVIQPAWRVEPYTNNSTDTYAKLIVTPLARTMDAAPTN